MTTGRINQVATVSRGRGTFGDARRPPVRNPQEGSRISRGSGKVRAGAETFPAPGFTRDVWRRRGAPRAIQLPPLSFPKGRSAPEPLRRGVCREPADWDIRPSRGGYQPPITPRGGGYRLRLAPECLADNGSQRPAVHRLPQAHRAGAPGGLQDPGQPLRPQLPARARGGFGSVQAIRHTSQGRATRCVYRTLPTVSGPSTKRQNKGAPASAARVTVKPPCSQAPPTGPI